MYYVICKSSQALGRHFRCWFKHLISWQSFKTDHFFYLVWVKCEIKMECFSCTKTWKRKCGNTARDSNDCSCYRLLYLAQNFASQGVEEKQFHCFWPWWTLATKMIGGYPNLLACCRLHLTTLFSTAALASLLWVTQRKAPMQSVWNWVWLSWTF